MITYTFNTTKIMKNDDNIVRVVEWEITFTDGTSSSIAAGKAVIPEELNVDVNDDIAEVVFNLLGGEELYMSRVQPMHEEMISLMTLESTLSEVPTE